MKTIRFPIAILFFVIITCVAQAQSVPALVNYQGRLSTPTGSPLPTADYQLTFKIYDSTNGTNLIWGPQIFDGTAGQGHGLQIPVVQGYFNVMLGPVDANGASLASAFNSTPRYVEITISNNAPIAPRQQILTVPFAFQTAYAALAGNVVSGINITNAVISGNGGGLTNLLTSQLSGMITGAQITPNTITSGQIANGTITSNQLASNSISFDRLAIRFLGTNVPVGGIAVSASCGNWNSPTPTTATTVSNFNLTITTQGNPVEVSFVSDGITHPSASVFYCVRGGGPFKIQLLRDGATNGVEDSEVSSAAGFDMPPGGFRFLDFPAPGTHTYQVQIWGDSATTSSAQYLQMFAREY